MGNGRFQYGKCLSFIFSLFFYFNMSFIFFILIVKFTTAVRREDKDALVINGTFVLKIMVC